MREKRQAAGNGACGVDDAHPICSGFTIKRPGVVVKPVGNELECLALHGRIAITDGGKLAACGEWRWLAGNTKHGFRMRHRGAQSHVSPMFIRKSIPFRTTWCGYV